MKLMLMICPPISCTIGEHVIIVSRQGVSLLGGFRARVWGCRVWDAHTHTHPEIGEPSRKAYSSYLVPGTDRFFVSALTRGASNLKYQNFLIFSFSYFVGKREAGQRTVLGILLQTDIRMDAHSPNYTPKP